MSIVGEQLTTEQAAADVLQAAGFDALAEGVRDGSASPQASVAMATRMSSGATKDILRKTQKLVGKPTLDVRY